MRKLVIVLVVLAVIAILFVAAGPFYVLQEGEQAVVTRFGAIVDTNVEAGLKFKMPVVDTVVKYPEKILSWDGDPQRIPTAENQFIWVDATARWQITDPALFYASVTTITNAFARLDDVIDSSVRTIVAENLLREAVRNSNYINIIPESEETVIRDPEGNVIEIEVAVGEEQKFYENIEKGRQKLSEEMYDLASEVAPQYGIDLVDIIIRQIRYSDDLTASVYNRMITERNKVAQRYRSIGEGQKVEWLGKLDNEKRSILSRAYETSEEIRGRADAEATRIYAEAARVDAEFYEFWRSIESYRKTLPQFRKTLSTDMDYFQYLHSMNGN